MKTAQGRASQKVSGENGKGRPPEIPGPHLLSFLPAREGRHPSVEILADGGLSLIVAQARLSQSDLAPAPVTRRWHPKVIC